MIILWCFGVPPFQETPIWMFSVAKIAQGSHELFRQKPVDHGVEEISATSAATSENRHRPLSQKNGRPLKHRFFVKIDFVQKGKKDIPSRELTYPTLGKGAKSSTQNTIFGGIR